MYMSASMFFNPFEVDVNTIEPMRWYYLIQVKNADGTDRTPDVAGATMGLKIHLLRKAESNWKDKNKWGNVPKRVPAEKHAEWREKRAARDQNAREQFTSGRYMFSTTAKDFDIEKNIGHL
jgi:hypothetical protein